MSQSGASDTDPAEAHGPLGRATPMEAVDLLLWALAELSGTVTILLDAGRGTHGIFSERGGTSSLLATVPSAFGDALVARLAIVAGLPVGLPGTQFGRLRVRLGIASVESRIADMLVAVRAMPAGLEGEVHRQAVGVPADDED